MMMALQSDVHFYRILCYWSPKSLSLSVIMSLLHQGSNVSSLDYILQSMVLWSMSWVCVWVTDWFVIYLLSCVVSVDDEDDDQFIFAHSVCHTNGMKAPTTEMKIKWSFLCCCVSWLMFPSWETFFFLFHKSSLIADLEGEVISEWHLRYDRHTHIIVGLLFLQSSQSIIFEWQRSNSSSVFSVSFFGSKDHNWTQRDKDNDDDIALRVRD